VKNIEAFADMAITAKTFGVRPSSFLEGISGLTAYMFDSAAALLLHYLQEGKKPITEVEDARNLLGMPPIQKGRR
jgi:hypothetical protein